MISYVHFPVLAVMGIFLGAFLEEIFGVHNKAARQGILVATTGIAFLLICALVKPVMFDGEVISYWMGDHVPVSGYAIGIGYEVDQLGLFFALLVVTTSLLSSIFSLRYMERDGMLGRFYVLFLMLCGAVLGLTLTGDIFNLFIMIEIMTFAAVALTAFRGERGFALEAAFKYLVLGSMGSSFTLAGIALLYLQCHTLNMAQLASMLHGNMTPVSVFAFGLMLTGLSVKAFIVPFHTPAADAYAAAPTCISMMFSGMVNKAGVYGVIRLVYVIFRAIDLPAMQVLLAIFGAVTMFIGVTMALAQHDFKRLLAFHSISQIGYVITAAALGTTLGLSGALFHAMNHTLFKGLLFLCAGSVLYSVGTTDLDRLGGLSKKMPQTTICFLIGAFSISGLPPFNGFASKWMVYQAIYAKAVESGNFLYALITVVAVVVSVMTLASFIKVTQAVFFGQCPVSCAGAKEVPLSMRIPMWVMSALCVITGVFYNQVEAWFLRPAVSAAFNVTHYIDVMMGEGTAAAFGISNVKAAAASFSYWDPILWLLLFVVVMAATGIVIITGARERGRILTPEGAEEDGKYATFFSGEKSLPSHVSGSDLFWGFKHDWKSYFRVMQGAHSGIINDYALWVVVGGAIITLWLTVFVR